LLVLSPDNFMVFMIEEGRGERELSEMLSKNEALLGSSRADRVEEGKVTGPRDLFFPLTTLS
jgi:hypothetical protein